MLSLLVVLACAAAVYANVNYPAGITYTSSNFAVDFSSSNALPTNGNPYLLGAVSVLNATTKVTFDAVRDPNCNANYLSCSSLGIYQTEVDETPSSSALIYQTTGAELKVATDFRLTAYHGPVTRYFYALVNCCTYTVTAQSTSEYA